MEIQMIRGNPIALVLVSIIFSIVAIVLAIVSYIKGLKINVGLLFIFIFVIIYNLGILIAFFLAYTKGNTRQIRKRKSKLLLERYQNNC